ncbi:MAG: BlaI/MecI/CopY family transcriptional regulator [Lachnospiraceae bacterium]|nr:BlaI/MecI/CopY family transcriptional regulator [Lachnospiraceae bacterium]
MSTPKIFESEYRFCKILWKNEPIRSGQLAKLCEEQLGWKKTTTFTVIKRLCERGVIANENMMVRALVKEDEAQTAEVEEMLDTRFDGSCMAFLTAFTRSEKLSKDEMEKLRKMIDSMDTRNEN